MPKKKQSTPPVDAEGAFEEKGVEPEVGEPEIREVEVGAPAPAPAEPKKSSNALEGRVLALEAELNGLKDRLFDLRPLIDALADRVDSLAAVQTAETTEGGATQEWVLSKIREIERQSRR